MGLPATERMLEALEQPKKRAWPKAPLPRCAPGLVVRASAVSAHARANASGKGHRLMNRTVATCALACAMLASSLHADGVTPLHDGWRLQSACMLGAAGDATSAPEFSTQRWIRSTAPTTVPAPQVAAGVVPDSFFRRQPAQNSRNFLSRRRELRESAHARRQLLPLRLVVSR